MKKKQQKHSRRKTDGYQKRAAEYVNSLQVAPPQEATLPSSKHFERLRIRIKALLQAALEQNEEQVRSFFKFFPYISSETQVRANSFVDNLPDKDIRRSLREYMKFGSRFGVRFTLKSKSSMFAIESARLSGVRFEGRIVGDALEPAIASQSSGLADFCNERLELPSGDDPLFESADAKWFVIHDYVGKSLLAQIEEVAYDPNAIVFVAHYTQSRQAFLFCLVGENVKDPVWKKAARIKAGFQRKLYSTATQGRTPNLDKRKKEYEALQSREPMKNIAADIVQDAAGGRGDRATDKQVSSEGRELRRRRSELKREG